MGRTQGPFGRLLGLVGRIWALKIMGRAPFLIGMRNLNRPLGAPTIREFRSIFKPIVVLVKKKAFWTGLSCSFASQYFCLYIYIYIYTIQDGSTRTRKGVNLHRLKSIGRVRSYTPRTNNPRCCSKVVTVSALEQGNFDRSLSVTKRKANGLTGAGKGNSAPIIPSNKILDPPSSSVDECENEAMY